MTVSLILRSWSFQPLILLGLMAAAASYAFAFYYLRRHGWLASMLRRGLIRRSQPWLFAAGLAVIVLALVSPIDALAGLLFSAHMVQHVLLIMVAPPLLLLGLPAPIVRLAIQELRIRPILAWLTHPIVAYLLFNGNLLLWHLPALYQATLHDELVHALEHALFFYTALFFWWRLLDPTGGWFPFWEWPPARWVYLIAMAPPSYVLGSILWSSNTVFYPFYEQVLRLWGFSAVADQQLGGLIMWVQGWMFVMISIVAYFLWYDPAAEQV